LLERTRGARFALAEEESKISSLETALDWRDFLDKGIGIKESSL
jgi:hypothetical protein